MSTENNFNSIVNTSISGSVLLSTLTGTDVQSLQIKGALRSSNVIDLTTLSNDLTADEIAQSVIGEQLVYMAGASAAMNLYLGGDTADIAARYISMLNITAAGTTYKKVLTFEMAQATASANILYLNNNSSTTSTTTFANVILWLNGATGTASAAAAYRQQLFAASAPAGRQVRVEVWATSITAGSEVVVFNVTTGNDA